MKKYFVGVDLGGMSAKGAIFNEDGELMTKKTVATNPQDGFEGTAGKIANLARDLAHAANVDFVYVESIGIAAPGYILSDSGVVVRWANYGWVDAPLGEEVQKLTGKKVFTGNDANVAALGEAKFGAGKEYKNIVMLTLGTGVGGGIVLDGKLVEGYRCAGAELGHMVIKEGGELCTCGRHGCLETYCSATALIRQTKKAMKANLTSKMWEYANGSLDNVNGKTAFLGAKDKDETALAIVEDYVDKLAVGIANLVNILRPEAVLLGGGVSNEGELLFSALREKVAPKLYTAVERVPLVIERAALGNDAGIYGAYALCRAL